MTTRHKPFTSDWWLEKAQDFMGKFYRTFNHEYVEKATYCRLRFRKSLGLKDNEF